MMINKKKSIIIGITFIIIGLSLALTFYTINYNNDIKKYNEAIRTFNKEVFLNENVSVIGYTTKYMRENFYEFEIIYKVKKKMNRNLCIYFHGLLENGGVQGMNFYPNILTMFWTENKYVIVKKVINLSPVIQEIRIGFFDLSNGTSYGEASFGKIDLSKIKV